MIYEDILHMMAMMTMMMLMMMMINILRVINDIVEPTILSSTN